MIADPRARFRPRVFGQGDIPAHRQFKQDAGNVRTRCFSTGDIGSQTRIDLQEGGRVAVAGRHELGTPHTGIIERFNKRLGVLDQVRSRRY